MIRKIGNNLYGDGGRSYRRMKKNGQMKLELVAWVQRRCVICQRFLSKQQLKFCKKCSQRDKSSRVDASLSRKSPEELGLKIACNSIGSAKSEWIF